MADTADNLIAQALAELGQAVREHGRYIREVEAQAILDALVREQETSRELREERDALLAEAPAGIKHFRQRAEWAEADARRTYALIDRIAAEHDGVTPEAYEEITDVTRAARAALAAGGDDEPSSNTVNPAGHTRVTGRARQGGTSVTGAGGDG